MDIRVQVELAGYRAILESKVSPDTREFRGSQVTRGFRVCLDILVPKELVGILESVDCQDIAESLVFQVIQEDLVTLVYLDLAVTRERRV